MLAVTRSLLIGLAVALGGVVPVMFVFLMWASLRMPKGAGEEVGIDVVSFARNTPSFWIVEGLIFIVASLCNYCYSKSKASSR